MADESLGEQGRESVERSYATAIDAIHRGEEADVVTTLITSLESAASRAGGDALLGKLRSALASVVPPGFPR